VIKDAQVVDDVVCWPVQKVTPLACMLQRDCTWLAARARSGWQNGISKFSTIDGL
jgi:hypothetical protein